MARRQFKRNIKIISFTLVFLFLAGLTGLFISLARLNSDYEEKQYRVNVLTERLDQVEEELKQERQKNANYGFLKYKVTAYNKRFPMFSKILDTVYYKSFQYGFTPEMVLGVIKVESNYEPTAVSHVGAYGLMQINLQVWKKALNINVHRIFDVEYNIDLGLKVLKHYYDETNGDIKRALHLYNNGYKYNNTSYIGKVDSAMLSLSPTKRSLFGGGY